MRILWFPSVLEPQYAALAELLRQEYPDLENSVAVYGHRGVRRSASARWCHVAVLSDYLREYLPAVPDLDYLRSVDETYGPPNLMLVAAADRTIWKYPRDRFFRTVEAGWRFAEDVMERVQPQAVISESIACLVSYALYLIARRRGIPYVYPNTGRLPGRVAFVGNHHEGWEKAEEVYRDLKRRELTGAEREVAEDFLRRFRGSRTRTVYFRSIKMPGVALRDLGRIAAYAADFRRDPNDLSMPHHPGHVVHHRIARIVRRRLADAWMFEQPVEGERFVLFPLHFQPEATTLVLAPFFLDQAALIENIARSLPADCLLYVKEHPFSVGRRPLEEYRRIRALPNVRLISPHVDGYELISRAAAVVTITGTMGWEAVLLERPVVTFGRTFYNAFDLVQHVTDLTALPVALRRAVTEFRPNRELLLKFIYGLHAGSHPGGVLAYEGVSPEEAMSEDNLRGLAAAIAAEVGLDTPRPRRGAVERCG